MNGLAIRRTLAARWYARLPVLPGVRSRSAMRKALVVLGVPVVLTALALALAATATGSPSAADQVPGCAKGSLNLVNDGRLTLGTDNPVFPPWWGGGETRKPWKVSNPYSGQGYESAVAYAVARMLGFAKAQVQWEHVPFAQS